MLICAVHDPVPLLRQLQAEHGDACTTEHLDQGPVRAEDSPDVAKVSRVDSHQACSLITGDRRLLPDSFFGEPTEVVILQQRFKTLIEAVGDHGRLGPAMAPEEHGGRIDP